VADPHYALVRKVSDQTDPVAAVIVVDVTPAGTHVFHIAGGHRKAQKNACRSDSGEHHFSCPNPYLVGSVV
jgi:hypothetical protein